MKDLDKIADKIARDAEQNYTQDPTIEKIKENTKNNICQFCGKQLGMFTSKKGNTYLANRDHSPHRKGKDECVNDWDEFNGVDKTKSTKELNNSDNQDYRLKIRESIKRVKIMEEEIINSLEENSSPQKVGLWMKLVSNEMNGGDLDE